MDFEQPKAHTSHTEISLDQLGDIQPGLARLMAEISDRYWILYYAAKGGNWKLAKLQASEVRKAFNIGSVTRPKYTGDLESFIEGPLGAIETAIDGLDWESFSAAYEVSVNAANAFHRKWDHEEIVWQLPDDPPKHLKLTTSEN